MRPDQASRRWAGVPEPHEAAPRAIAAYLGAYGPATIDHFGRFLSRGRVSKRSLRGWFADLGDKVTEVDVDGEAAYVLSDHVDELAESRPTRAVRLVGGFDQWVLGPGTEDAHVIASARRREVSKQSGWIAPIVVAGGAVAGTWEFAGDTLAISWFREAGKPPARGLAAEARRVSAVTGRKLRHEVAAV
jgi:hypothetical protein